jgi:arabinofuranosyltransferase
MVHRIDRSRPVTGSGSRSRVRPDLPALLGLLALGLILLVHLEQWSFLCDDAFISFRYARNFGEHGAPVYNLDPLEKVEGYTNPLWMVVLALGVVVGLMPEQLAPVLTAASSLVGLVLVAAIAAELRRVGPQPERTPLFEPIDLLAPALLVLIPEYVVWASSGLETSFALALGLAAVYAWLRGRIVAAALLAALTGLTRLDALLWLASFGLAWLVVVGFEQRARLQLRALPWKRIGVGLAVFVGVLGVTMSIRAEYYGSGMNNTWAIKKHGALLRDSYGVGYLRFWFDRLQLIAALPLLVLTKPRHLLVLVPLAAQLIWVWSIGGDFMAYSRFLLPATVLAALAIALSFVRVDELLGSRVATRLRVAIVAGLALVPVIVLALRIPVRLAEDREHPHLHVDYDERDSPGFEGVRAMDRFARVRLAAGARLREVVPADTWISVGAAGAMPYASRLPAFDVYGLVDPHVLLETGPDSGPRARPGHQVRAELHYVNTRKPDLMCHIGWEAPRPPTVREAQRRAGWDWAWACVETGPIADPLGETGTLESRWYCCLRPRDRYIELDPNPEDPAR